jgi:hypothetical protein
MKGIALCSQAFLDLVGPQQPKQLSPPGEVGLITEGVPALLKLLGQIYYTI